MYCSGHTANDFERHAQQQNGSIAFTVRRKRMTKVVNLVLIILVLGVFCISDASGQTTEISYQGNLKESGLPANANYDIEFRLYGALTGGTLIGTEIFLSPVAVSDGVFSVKLDFGPNGFPGQDRYLEIAVRRTGVGSLVTLGPRQKISSAPYAIQSLQAATATTALIAGNAQALGGVAAAQYILNSDVRLSDARNPLPGSASYIQNTNSLQSASNFNVSGTGGANVFNATASYNFGGAHLISAAGSDNIFAGGGSGLLNLGSNNAFFGAKAGFENKQGSFNAIFGAYAGQNNVTGNNNSFFGYFAGNGNTSGNDNSFFGNRAGQVNTSGAFNSFFGTFSGFFNSTGSDNSFFGIETGFNSNGNRNSFFGSRAGRDNSTGADNAFLGSFAGRANTTGSNNSFVGSNAGQANATGANNSFFGAQAGFTNTASNNSFFGTDAGRFNTSGANNTFLGRGAGHDNTAGELNVFIGLNAGSLNTLGRNNTVIGSEANVLGTNLSYATAIGAEAIVNSSNTVVLGRPADTVRVPGNLSILGTLTAATLSISASNLTGVVGTPNGGTGLSSPGMAGRFLRSDGTNWQSLPLTVADILAGSPNYVQNTTIQQGSTNFNISGNGTAGGTLSANVVNSATQFNIGGSRVLAASGSNLFSGLSAGTANTTGTSNSFFGSSAGAGNTAGGNNSFFGSGSGLNSSSGGNNTFAGASSGSGNTLGTSNAFFGVSAGQTNTIGSNNTVIGANANVGGNNLTYATAVGADSVVSTNNTVVLGRNVDTVRAPGNLQVDGNLIANNFSVNAANLTGTVGVANGGTGMNASGASGNYLRSNGSAWVSSAIAAGDLPAGNTNYIQNGLGVQSSSNFNISGNGTVGGVLAGNSVNSSTQYNILGTRVLSNAGSSNIFVGAGTATTGNDNSFVGFGAGSSNTTGFSNTILGSGANVGAGNLSHATAIGAGATVSNNDSVVLGRAADTVRIPGNLVLTGTFTAASFTLPATSLTGTVAAANGGTGLNSPGTTGNFLRSTGTGWQSQGLTASDIPSGSNSYIQNGAGLQPGATFNIGGNGVIGGNLSVGGTITGSFSVPAANITGILGIAAGGTGVSSSGLTGNVLRSNGTIWTSSPLLAADIPSLAANYVQNTTNPQVGANFNVGGNGTIGGTLTVGGAINGTLATTNLNGVVSVPNGGTGLNSAGTSGHFLKSNGTGFTTSALVPSDIPSLASSYVQNSGTQQVGGTFNIGGNGTIGGNLNVGGTITGSISVPATSITGILGIPSGGTGLTSPGTSGHFLKSTGTGFTTAALSASDIPSLASSYIQNNGTAQAGATFNIGGNGTIGGSLTVGGTINGTFSVPANNLTGFVDVARGGTGLTSAGTSGHFLKSTGSGYTTSALAAGDIPLGSTHYVQNTTSPQAATNFNVAGSGAVGTNLSVGGNLTVTGTITGGFSVPVGNITGTLGTANGGTGLSSVGTTGNFLRSNGTTWSSTALVAADLPTGSSNYIQNSASPQAASNFNVTGNGVVGTDLTVGGDLTVNGTLNGSFSIPANNITGTLGSGFGGTGLSSSTGTQFLRGNGSGGWTSGTLAVGDIPSLGGTYILNQTTPQTTSNFNVSGNGTVGGTMNADVFNATSQFNIGSTRVLGTNPSGSVFVGNGAGNAGGSNAFFGTNAGNTNSTGSSNTAVGAEADVAAGGLVNATAIGANASVSQSNSVVLGGVTGVNGGTSTSVGIGTTAPKAKLDVTGGSILVGTPGQGIILKSPDGLTCKLLSIDNVGAMVLGNTTCP